MILPTTGFWNITGCELPEDNRIIWLDAKTPDSIELDPGEMTMYRWHDASGNGQYFSNKTSTHPVYNGVDAIEFVSSPTSGTRGNIPSSMTQCSIFITIKTGSNVINNQMLYATSWSQTASSGAVAHVPWVWISGRNIRYQIRDGGSGAFPISENTKVVIALIWDGVTGKIFENGELIQTLNTPNSFFNGMTQQSISNRSHNNTDPFRGTYYSFLMYDRGLTDKEVECTNEYLMKRYDI